MRSEIRVSCPDLTWANGKIKDGDFDYLTHCVKDVVPLLELFGYYGIKTILDNDMVFHIIINCERPLLMNHFYYIRSRYADDVYWEYTSADDSEEGMEKE